MKFILVLVVSLWSYNVFSQSTYTSFQVIIITDIKKGIKSDELLLHNLYVKSGFRLDSNTHVIEIYIPHKENKIKKSNCSFVKIDAALLKSVLNYRSDEAYYFDFNSFNLKGHILTFENYVKGKLEDYSYDKSKSRGKGYIKTKPDKNRCKW